jgi:acyl-CoA synthetase (AMP-forming)/AMP-acid ligase II
MESTKSNKIFFTAELAPLVKAMITANPKIIGTQMKSFDEMILPSPEYPYSETWSEAIDKPIVVLHSSGSTGIPKPVIMTHGTCAVFDNEHNLPMVPGRDKQDITMWTGKDADSSKYYHIFPPFHLAGFMTTIIVPTFTHATPVLGPPTSLPTSQLISQVMKQQKVRSFCSAFSRRSTIART